MVSPFENEAILPLLGIVKDYFLNFQLFTDPTTWHIGENSKHCTAVRVSPFLVMPSLERENATETSLLKSKGTTSQRERLSEGCSSSGYSILLP